MSSIGRERIRHMLSIDAEEYFHCEAFREVIGPDRRRQWPSRIEHQMDELLAVLAETQARATFFVLGAVTRSHPRVVGRIRAAGHEIACHGDSHEMPARLGPEGFRRETADAKARLEDLTGERVLGYRAATFGLVRRTAWVIDILSDLGFTYDSSVQPVHHDRYGVPNAPRHAHMAAGPGGCTILEIPPMTGRLLGRNIPLGGGGYFRLLPVVIFDRALRAWARRGRPGMLYLHPWELDGDQPAVPAGPLATFRHRVNLHRTSGKLRTLLRAHHFIAVRDLLADLRQTTSTFHYCGSVAI